MASIDRVTLRRDAINRMHVSWALLGLGILFEVTGTICMKLSNGLERPWPSALMFVFYALSLISLSFAMRHIDVGVAYAIWSAMGIALVMTVGMLWFGEPATTSRLFWVLLIVCGVIGLRAASVGV